MNLKNGKEPISQNQAVRHYFFFPKNVSALPECLLHDNYFMVSEATMQAS